MWGQRPFIGFVGLSPADPELAFAPAVEVGWRLHRRHWGRGYATEAAREAVRFAFDRLRLPELVSFAAAVKPPSGRVMERLGMSRDPAADFHHPRIAAGPLRRHVLYRLVRSPRDGSRVV